MPIFCFSGVIKDTPFPIDIQEFPSLQEASYHERLQEFYAVKVYLDGLKSFWFTEKINSIFLKGKDYVVKRPDKLNFWVYPCVYEIACLFSLEQHFVPSFFYERDEFQFVVQPFERYINLEHSNLSDNWTSRYYKAFLVPSAEILGRVTQSEYWRALMAAFLLGMLDLSATNVGITEDGQVRFFDLDQVFHEIFFKATDKTFDIAFTSSMFDWPQFETEIGQHLASELTNWVSDLKVGEEHFKYFKNQKVPEAFVDSFLTRLCIMKSFKFNESTNFMDFLVFLYGENLKDKQKELMFWASKDLGFPVGLGGALIWLKSPLHFYEPYYKEALLLFCDG